MNKAFVKLLYDNKKSVDEIALITKLSKWQIQAWINQWKKVNYFKKSENLKYHTPEYKAWRMFCLQRDKFICQVCGKRKKSMQVDHIKSWKFNPALRYDPKNGRTICKTCHGNTKTTRRFKYYGAKRD